ncbi:MAG: type I-E CRISPR-associated protein Cas6/Cse3/CasE, partial [Armatimonadetes bacterium]|nr:type I-E CRISPR-associated protein Cas6/Cse3/CasE [Armatimonadota bacterium]
WRRFDLRGEWAQLEWLDMQATGQRRGQPIAGHGGHGFDFPARHEWSVRRTADGPEERLWLPDVVANEVGLQQGLHRSDGSSARLFHRLVDFEGLLIVTDPPRFCEALRRGIGPAKAFGCGLLSVAPAG